jgi:hypothetical protein
MRDFIYTGVLPNLVAITFVITAIKPAEPDDDGPLRTCAFVAFFLVSVFLTGCFVLGWVQERGLIRTVWKLAKLLFKFGVVVPRAWFRGLEANFFARTMFAVASANLLVGLGFWTYLHLNPSEIFKATKDFILLILELDWKRLALEAEVWLDSWFVRHVVRAARWVVTFELVLIKQNPVYGLAAVFVFTGGLFLLHMLFLLWNLIWRGCKEDFTKEANDGCLRDCTESSLGRALKAEFDKL